MDLNWPKVKYDMWKITQRKTITLVQVILLALALCGVFSHSQISFAADVEVLATLSESTIYLGDLTTLELRVTSSRDSQPPTLKLPGLEITRSKSQHFNKSSIAIINGHTTRVKNFGYVTKYQLRPSRVGVFQIPALSITHNSRKYHSQPLQLTVKAPEAQDLLLVSVTRDKPNYILGEDITLTLEVSLRKLTLDGRELDIAPFFPKEPPHLQIPWFEGLSDWKTTNLQEFVKPYIDSQESGFHINNYVDQRSFFGRNRISFTLPRQQTEHTRPSGTFVYYTYRLQKTFRPIRAGTKTVASVLVKATLPTRIDAQRRVRGTKTVVASSTPLQVTINPVPSANQPASFNGSVGQFQLSATAAPIVLKVGDPLTLTVTVHGQQSSLLETARPLALHQQGTLTKDFKVPSDPPTIQTEQTTKTFTYTIRPRHAEVKAIPPIEMAYFDPETKQFHHIFSDAISLQVERGKAFPTSEVITMESRRPKSRLGPQLAAGLLANYTGPEVLIPQRAQLQFTPLIAALLISPPP